MLKVSGVYVVVCNSDVGMYKISGAGDFFSAAAKTVSFHYKGLHNERPKNRRGELCLKDGYSFQSEDFNLLTQLYLDECNNADEMDEHNLRQLCYLIEVYVDLYYKSSYNRDRFSHLGCGKTTRNVDFLSYFKNGLLGFSKVLSTFIRLTDSKTAKMTLKDCMSLSEILGTCKTFSDLLESCPPGREDNLEDVKLIEPFKSHPMADLLMYCVHSDGDLDGEDYGEAPWLRDGYKERMEEQKRREDEYQKELRKKKYGPVKYFAGECNPYTRCSDGDDIPVQFCLSWNVKTNDGEVLVRCNFGTPFHILKILFYGTPLPIFGNQTVGNRAGGFSISDSLSGLPIKTNTSFFDRKALDSVGYDHERWWDLGKHMHRSNLCWLGWFYQGMIDEEITEGGQDGLDAVKKFLPSMIKSLGWYNGITSGCNNMAGGIKDCLCDLYHRIKDIRSIQDLFEGGKLLEEFYYENIKGTFSGNRCRELLIHASLPTEERNKRLPVWVMLWEKDRCPTDWDDVPADFLPAAEKV